MEHLKSTIDLIESIIENRDDKEYYTLLYIFYDYLSNENLAIVFSKVFSKEIAKVMNDIYSINNQEITFSKVYKVLKKLEKNGFESWTMED